MSNPPPVYSHTKPNFIHFQKVQLDACVRVHKYFHVCVYTSKSDISGEQSILFFT